MAAIGLTNPVQQFIGTLGPLSGGFVYTYEAATSFATPQATYTDSGLSVANTNPIQLDAAGRCIMYLMPSPAYAIVVQDASAQEIYRQDNISPAAVA